MTLSPHERFFAHISRQEELDATVDYLAKLFAPIVKSSESTLICFPSQNERDFGSLAGRAVRQCGGMPVYWQKDLRWKELLRLAFRSKASTIIATPLILLGLTKIAFFENIPLLFYNVVMAGYPCMDWVLDGISKWLDCAHWGIFSTANTCMVGGFACSSSLGVHLRDDKFIAQLVDEQGSLLPETGEGEVILRLKEEPEIWMRTGLLGRFLPGKCPCGNPAPRLYGLGTTQDIDRKLVDVTQELLKWSSVLDCVFSSSPSGLELEVVTFPGEKLPQFPSCAKLSIRQWDPEKTAPLPMGAGWMLL